MKEKIKINSKIKLDLTKDGEIDIKVVGEKEIDNYLLKMNELGSGSKKVEPQPIFHKIKSLIKALKSFGKLKMKPYKDNDK